MSDDGRTQHCLKCGRVLTAEGPCPACGSVRRRIGLSILDELIPRDNWTFRLTENGLPSKKKRRVEGVSKWEVYAETGRLRQVERAVDRNTGRYIETIRDIDGNVLKHVDEPLAQHRGRGSAGRKKNRPR